MGSMLESVCGSLRTSVLGFGCGSVMGRVGRSASLRAMDAAWESGITLFDTARSYGFGEAEAVGGWDGAIGVQSAGDARASAGEGESGENVWGIFGGGVAGLGRDQLAR